MKLAELDALVEALRAMGEAGPCLMGGEDYAAEDAAERHRYWTAYEAARAFLLKEARRKGYTYKRLEEPTAIPSKEA